MTEPAARPVVTRCPRCGGPRTERVLARDRDGGPPCPVATCLAPDCGLGETLAPRSVATPRPRMVEAPPSREAAGAGPLATLARAMIARQVHPLTRRLPTGARVADLGAGAGARSAVMASAGMHVIAVEPDTAEAARLRRSAGSRVKVVSGALEDWLATRPAGELDGVLMWHVLEHLTDPVAALTAARRAVRAGGWLLVAVPNPRSWEAAAFGGRWHGWDPARHRWHMPAPALSRMLTEAGWTPCSVGPRGGWGYPTGTAYSLAPSLDPQRASGRWCAAAGMALAAASVPIALSARGAGRGAQLVAIAHAGGVG